MSSLSQALRLGDMPSPHSAFQEHAAHSIEWSMALSSKGSSGTCIPEVLRHSSILLSRRSASLRYATTYSRIVRNWIIYLDMSGLIARKQHRPLEQPGITAGTQPLGGPGPARALATGSPAPAPPRAPGPRRASLVASWLFPPASRVPPTPADRGETGCLAFAAQAAWGTEACRRPWGC